MRRKYEAEEEQKKRQSLQNTSLTMNSQPDYPGYPPNYTPSTNNNFNGLQPIRLFDTPQPQVDFTLRILGVKDKETGCEVIF